MRLSEGRAQHTRSREEGRKGLHQDGGGWRGSHGMDTLVVTPQARGRKGARETRRRLA